MWVDSGPYRGLICVSAKVPDVLLSVQTLTFLTVDSTDDDDEVRTSSDGVETETRGGDQDQEA